MRILENKALLFAGSLLGLIPLLFSLNTNDPVVYPQLLGMLAFCAGWAVFFLRKPLQAPLIPALPWLPLKLFALLTALSSFWALNAAETWFVTARWGIVLVLILLIQLADAEWKDWVPNVSKVLIVSLSLHAMVGILQFLGIDPLHLSQAPHSPDGLFANRNFYGTALTAGIPFLIYGYYRLRHVWRWLAIMAIALSLAGIMLSLARAALIPLILAFAFLLPVMIIRHRQGAKRWILLGVWALCLGMVIWSTQFILRQKEATIRLEYLLEDGHLVDSQTSSLDYRLITWHHSLALAKEKQLLGWGAGNWKLQIPRLGLQSPNAQGEYGMLIPLHPHNEFLLAYSELGVVGLFLFFGIWGMGIVGALKQAINKQGKYDATLGTLLLLAWLSLLVDSNFSFPMERPFHLIQFSLVMGLSMRAYAPSQMLAAKMRYLLMGILVLLCLAGVDLVARLQADLVMRKMRDAKAAHQPAKVLKEAPKADNWASQLDPVSALSSQWYTAMAHAELGQLPAAMEAMKTVKLISPYSLAYRSSETSLLDMSGRFAEAIELQNGLLRTFPNFTEGWLNLAVMYAHAAKLPEARAALGKVSAQEFPERYAQVDAYLKANNQ